MYKKLFKINLILLMLVMLFWGYYLIDYAKNNSHSNIEFYPYNDFYYANEEISDISDYVIPELLVDYIVENEWGIYFSTLNIEPLFGYNKDIFSDRLGVTLMNENKVFVEVKGDKSQSLRTFYHELGHVYDKSLGMHSSTEEFKSLYEEYKDIYEYPFKIHRIFKDTYMNSTPSEFFAGIFEAYVYYPEYLTSNYPEIYDYFNKL